MARGRWGHKYTYMGKKDYSSSRFKLLIRIDPKQLKWIREIKGKYTLAGKLDQIINHYKKHKAKNINLKEYEEKRTGSA